MGYPPTEGMAAWLGAQDGRSRREITSHIYERIRNRNEISGSEIYALLSRGVGTYDDIRLSGGATQSRRGSLYAVDVLGELAEFTAGVPGCWGEEGKRKIVNPGARLLWTVDGSDGLRECLYFWRPERPVWDGLALHSKGLPFGATPGPMLHYAHPIEGKRGNQVLLLTTSPPEGANLWNASRGAAASPVATIVPGCAVPPDFARRLREAGFTHVWFIRGGGWQSCTKQVDDVRRQCEVEGVGFVNLADFDSEAATVASW
ncbi:MAG: hypothetical protein NDJ92_16800, partial [Thermoanaerobaculia bacterium]|nr:hypothetical protein [Thermoanaerobaculia bacterium]